MPELPEVETTRSGLELSVLGKSIKKTHVFRRDLRFAIPSTLEKNLAGKTILSIRRRAKYLLFDIEDGGVLLVHLGMSGTLTLVDPKSHVKRKHEHVWWDLSPSLRMVFHDPRRFGAVLYFLQQEEKDHPLLRHLGVEPLSNAWSAHTLAVAMQHRKTAIKIALMDQRLVVGVGNIYASESLYRAKIHPQTSAHNAMKRKEALANAVVDVLRAALESGGSTLRDYVRSAGDSGYFQHQFSVYDREGMPCSHCATPISRIVQANRSSFFCAQCQPKISEQL